MFIPTSSPSQEVPNTDMNPDREARGQVADEGREWNQQERRPGRGANVTDGDEGQRRTGTWSVGNGTWDRVECREWKMG